MLRQTIWTIVILLILVSCKKEKFPDKDNLIGTWREQTDNLFMHKLVFDTETIIFYRSNTIDTFSYRLDKENKLIFLTLKNNSSIGESSHEILQNKKSKTLTIFGLFPTTDKATETKFKKE